MFLIRVTYKKPLTLIDEHLAAHRAFLEAGYQKDFFIVSGPQNPRIGGIILSQLTDRKQLEEILAQDPFALNDLAEYELIDFEPVKCHPNFKCFTGST
jgi:uncharacterized protein YciI